MVVPLGEQQTTWLCIKFKKSAKSTHPTVQCTQDTSTSKVHTHTPHHKLLNAADRISDVVFLTASCFLMSPVWRRREVA